MTKYTYPKALAWRHVEGKIGKSDLNTTCVGKYTFQIALNFLLEYNSKKVDLLPFNKILFIIQII